MHSITIHHMEQSDPNLWACMHLDTATPLMALTHMPHHVRLHFSAHEACVNGSSKKESATPRKMAHVLWPIQVLPLQWLLL